MYDFVQKGKPNNYLEDTNVSDLLLNIMPKNAYLKRYLCLQYDFGSQQNKPDPGFRCHSFLSVDF